MPEITNSVYNLGNPTFAKRIFNSQKRYKPQPQQPQQPQHSDFDIVVIGGGITGTYLTRRLTSQYPRLKILLIEKTDRIGGKFLSSYLGPDENPYNTALEYGGMRIFPSIQPRISKLLEFLNLTKVAVPYSSPNNLFSGRTKTFLNSELFPNTKSAYFLEPEEENAEVFTTVNDNIYDKFNDYGVDSNPLYQYRIIAFKNPGLSGLCFRNEVMEGQVSISTENYRRFSDISGYTGFFYGKGSFVSLAYENISLNDFDTTQYFIKEGYQQVPVGCVNNFKTVSFNDIKNNNFTENNSLLMNTELLKFSVMNNNIEITVSNGNENISLKSKKLFITTPTNTLQSIEGFPDEYYTNFTRHLKQIPLFKIFLKYETNWWNDIGFSIGRSTTDMPINQVWFYNNNTLLIYAVGEDAEFWEQQLPKLEQIDLIDVNSPYPSFLSYLMTFVKKVFKDYIDVPFPNKIGWKYWSSGGGFWNTLDETEPNKSIYDIGQDMINIFGTNGNVNYINNDISFNQGWGEGSIEIVDQFLQDKYNMPGILEIDNL